MKIENLKRGNEIQKLLKSFEEALNCFEYKHAGDGESLLENQISTNPKLMLEFDDYSNEGDKSIIPVPNVLSDDLIGLIKQGILLNIQLLESEFNDL